MSCTVVRSAGAVTAYSVEPGDDYKCPADSYNHTGPVTRTHVRRTGYEERHSEMPMLLAISFRGVRCKTSTQSIART